MPPEAAKFCPGCGGPLQLCIPEGDSRQRPVCTQCGRILYRGPEVLVLTLVVAKGKLLLIRRGTPPYLGQWAPPGGYVEAGESPESAAVRELREEAGVELSRDQLKPFALMSFPELNQIHMSFLAILEEPLALYPRAPEALDACWFAESEYPIAEVWDPGRAFDIRRFYERVRSGRFEFYQLFEDGLRIIDADSRVEYVWRR
jgi:ADP-ribose pyrophosphatase YjhB (NUDIX family)